MTNEWELCVHPDELENNITNGKLDVLCICNLGYERSLEKAHVLFILNIKALFLRGGIWGIKGSSKHDQDLFFDAASRIRKVVILLEPPERIYYEELLLRFESERHTPLMYFDDSMDLKDVISYIHVE